MYYLEELIKKRLGKLHPNFDYLHTEHKMYTVAVEDFINYCAVKWRLSIDDVKIKFEQELEERGLDLKEEVDAWVSLWLVVWKKRVKLVFTDEEFNRQDNMVHKLMRKDSTERKYRNVSYQRVKQFKWSIIECLIQNGLICFTSVLAREIIKQRLSVYKKPFNSAKDKIEALQFIMKRVRNLSRINSPLIFLKVNKSLFR